MRSTLNSFIVDFGQCQPTNYSRIASVSAITGIHLTNLENALVVAQNLGTAEVCGGGINHIIDRVSCSPDCIRFRVYNRYETCDRDTDAPLVVPK